MHDKTILLVKRKINAIEFLVSKVLSNSIFSRDKFLLVK